MSAGSDHVSRIWAMTAKRQVGAFEVHDRPALAVAGSADGKTIFSGRADPDLDRWRAPAEEKKE